MSFSEPVKLSAPVGIVSIRADSAPIYEISFALAQTSMSRNGEDLIISFQNGGRLILTGFYDAGAMQPKFLIAGENFVSFRARECKEVTDAWKAVPGECGIYRRMGNKVVEYQLKSMRRGKRYIDTLGPMELDEARRIRDLLDENRESGQGPQSYKEMRSPKKSSKENTQTQSYTVATFRKEIFLPHRAAMGRSEMDAKLMECRWKNHLAEFFGSISLDALTQADFDIYVQKMRKNSDFGDTTILHCLVDLRRMWSCAESYGIVSRYFPGKTAIRQIARTLDNEKKCFLEPEEASRLARAAYDRRLRSRLDHDIYCYVMLGLGLGLRAGEIHKLTAQAVERRIIEKTKNGRSRFVHFGFGPVRSMLEERLTLYPPASPNEPLFKALGRNAKSAARQSVPRKYYALIRELGFNETDKRSGQPLERIDFHALRHTFATLAAMRGVDHLTLMRLMGHRSPAMTLRYIEIAEAHQASRQEQAMRGIFPQELEKEEP